MVGSHLCTRLSPLQQPCFVLKPLLYAPGQDGPMLYEMSAAGASQPGLDPLHSASSHQLVTKQWGRPTPEAHPTPWALNRLWAAQEMNGPFTWGDMATSGNHSHKDHSGSPTKTLKCCHREVVGAK